MNRQAQAELASAFRRTMLPRAAAAPYGVQATKGHIQGNGGLRGHSVGEFYPAVVYAEGTMDKLFWRILYPDGTHSARFPDIELAHAAAHIFKEKGIKYESNNRGTETSA